MADESGCIGLLVGVVAIVIVVVLAIQYWYITLLLVVIGFGVYFFVKEHKDKKLHERAAEAAAREREARRQHHRDEQQGIHRQLTALCENTITIFESIPNHLLSAERYLDQAEVDFADGVFVPFWDSVENAAKNLGRFDESIHIINENSSRYTDLQKKYEDTPPQFPVARQSIAKLGVGTITAQRMEAIVRKAHGNHDFADIYMQYKTNQILVAGFTNLAQALNQMTWQITASIDILGESVDVMNSALKESMRAIHSRMGEIAERNIQHRGELAQRSSAREKEALEMLDNIQRGRRPFL